MIFDKVFLIGSIAALLTTVSFLPQVVKAHKTKHTKDLSLAMWVLFSAGITLWMVYGFFLKAIPIIAANAITLSMSLYILYLKVKNG